MMKYALILIIILQSSLSFSKSSELDENIITKFFSLFSNEEKTICDDIDRQIDENKINGVEVSTISEEYLNEIFQKLASDPTIPFMYPEDGCYARAHKMAMEMDKVGIKTAKAFLIGSLYVETPNAEKGYVWWGYHVAPLIKVRTKDGVKDYIIDPSLFTKPVSLDDWIKIQTTKNQNPAYKHHVSIKNQYAYLPVEDNIKNKFESEDKKSMNETLSEYLKIQTRRQSEKILNLSTPNKFKPDGESEKLNPIQ